MDLLSKSFQRGIVFVGGVSIFWLVVWQIFPRLDRHLPLVLALFGTYLVTSYVILPRFVRFCVWILQYGKVPRMTREFEGFYADPVNIVLKGTVADLEQAFLAIGWNKADSLTCKSACGMIKSFLLNKSYPNAPFSDLYLFGRNQDLGFQEAIGTSPRQRHHIRFWALHFDPAKDLENIFLWNQNHTIDPNESSIWVGACSKDVGFGFKHWSYRLTHRTDKEIDEERDYIVSLLRDKNLIKEAKYIQAGDEVGRRYVSDGKVFWGRLD